MESFDAFFASAARGRQPYPYQVHLAHEPWPETLVIPTGFGKTAAVLAAWLWKLSQPIAGTPLRLIYCLPMRTLVEQTAAVAQDWLTAAVQAFGWSEEEQPLLQVTMGGQSRPRGAPDWMLQPDRPALIIGTQDMLVSAALMRAYGVSRFRWPVDFALLHHDALWVFDEVQLAGATLPTSAQLQGWRQSSRLAPQTDGLPFVPARTLWMSATFDPGWLKTVDFGSRDRPRATDLTTQDLSLDHPARLWHAVKRVSPGPRPVALKSEKDRQAYASTLVKLVWSHLRPDTTVLVFVNTVARAQDLYRALADAKTEGVVLIHSRFRRQEREAATRSAKAKPKVIVATQALEAGVDLSSSVLISELAPWSSMVQRFGRCNRYGECGPDGAELLWIDLPPGAEAPYNADELDEARAKLGGLSDASPKALSQIAPGAVRPSPVIRQSDLLDLFDTEPDLSGFDVDVSVYVRDAQDLDLRLFWRDVAANREPEGAQAASPTRDELCPASLVAVRTLLKRKGVRAWRADRLRRDRTIWVRVTAAELRPGLELMVASDAGGYDPELGFIAESAALVPPTGEADRAQSPASLDDDLDTDVGSAVSLADHSRHARDEMQRLCEALRIDGALRELLVEAALWHDRGKAHSAFQQMLSADWRAGDDLLAKSKGRPKVAGQETRGERTPDPDLRRPRFRHELASMLSFLDQKDWAREADLAAYLILAHHGKVRMRLRALPDEKIAEGGRLFARGVWDGDHLAGAKLGETMAPASTLELDVMQLGEGRHGASWTTRTQALLDRYGPFRLAWLESLVRIADWRASRAEQHAAEHDLDPHTLWGRHMSQGEGE